MTKQALEGVKILDFSWIGVGPVTVKYFADHGATVIHVESNGRPDSLRVGGPFRDNTAGLDRSGFFADFNSSKYGASLNLSNPKAREIALRMVQWADVVAESFTPKAMKNWGLDYESLAKIKPEIIMYSTCLQGQTGPFNMYPGFGGQGAALSGYYSMVGWPDRPPAGPYGAYTDFINPRLGALAIAAALEYKRRTGKGTHIDLAQAEGGIQFMAPNILEWTVNGRVPPRMGNRSPHMAPHGSYRCAGNDRWLAITVTNDGEWDALGRALGEPEWSKDPRFQTLLGRMEHQDELDAAIEALTCSQDAWELMRRLQEAGVPAGVVNKTSDLFSDPQLEHRHHFQILDHTEMGPSAYDGPNFTMSKTPEQMRAAPCLGEHNDFVYRELIGLSEDEFTECLIEGVFE